MPNCDSGEDLIGIAKVELKGKAPESIQELCAGRTRQECLAMANKFKSDKEQLDKFIDPKKYPGIIV